MESRTTFRFEAGDVRFELTGSEDFVRRNLTMLLPFVQKVVTAPNAGSVAPAPSAAPAAPAAVTAAPSAASPAAASSAPAAPAAPMELTEWWAKHVTEGTRVSMQDTILVLAYWMRTFRKFIFGSDDIRKGFATLGMEEPKSLLQILGTLKRDHNLILGTERRGEYMLNTTGIDRVRQICGIPGPRGAGASGGQRDD